MAESLLRHLSDASAVNVMAFVGGFIDGAGYIELKQLFTSSITGNVVVACTSVTGNNNGVVSRAIVTISFVVAGFLATITAMKLKLSRNWKVRAVGLTLFSLELTALIVSLVLGLVYRDQIKNTDSVDNGCEKYIFDEINSYSSLCRRYSRWLGLLLRHGDPQCRRKGVFC